jgi:PAS domain S-box-containing protein
LYKAMHENRRVGPQVQPYRRADGVLVQFEVTAAPVPDRTNGSLAVAAIQDVTAKLIAEAQARHVATLRESEERFRLVAEQAPIMLWMSDANGTCIYLNKTLRDFQEGTAADWSSLLTEPDRPRFLDELAAALLTQQGFCMEAQCRRAAGTLHLLHITACPRFSTEQEFVGLIGVNADITEARQAQRDLQQLNELLEQRVAAAVAEKAEAEAALMHAQRLDALGRLTGGVAHDFNNLLTVVIGALDIILRQPENAARRKRLGEAALAAARHGERLTAQLLAFARRQPLQTEACDLNELIREFAPLLRRVTGEALSLELDLCEDRAVALIDPAQFEASLLNLLVNAADASLAGSEILLETRLCGIAAGELPNLAAGQYLRLTVSDRGEGMSPAVVSRIFEPFFTTKPAGKGTGLGLSQVYGFVRQSGGDVQVQSTQGEGTCFSVYLPVGAEQTAAFPVRDLALNPAGLSLCVLLTEDDPSVAGIVEVMLGDLGHQVIRAANAEEALQILRSEAEIDLLLSDVVMPGGMNGVDLAKQAVELRPQVKVLLSSGYAGESIDGSLAQGGWAFLRKPYLASELAQALANLSPDAPSDPAVIRLA